jgi:hypothetical protein
MLPVGDAMTQLVHIRNEKQRIIHRYTYFVIDFLLIKTRAWNGQTGPDSSRVLVIRSQIYSYSTIGANKFGAQISRDRHMDH